MFDVVLPYHGEAENPKVPELDRRESVVLGL